MNLQIFLEALSDEQKQQLRELLNGPGYKELTRITDFIRDNKHRMSTRLQNILKYNQWAIGDFVETVDPDQLKNVRNAGEKTKQEFIKLRGY